MNDIDTDEIAEQVAAKVVGYLGTSVISSSFPAEIGDWIRKTCEHGQTRWIYTVPMTPPGYAMTALFTMTPDGTLTLELRDMNNQTFWQGTFKPADY